MMFGMMCVSAIGVKQPEMLQAATPKTTVSSNFNITDSNGNISIDGMEYFTTAQQAFSADGSKAEISNNSSGMYFGEGHSDWKLIKTKKYTTAYDREDLVVKAKGLSSHKMSVTTETTVKLTGSTKFNFAEVAEASLSCEVGTTWGKTKEETIKKPKKCYRYILEGYCVVKKRKYECIDYDNNKRLTAASHDKVKAVTSFDKEKIKK